MQLHRCQRRWGSLREHAAATMAEVGMRAIWYASSRLQHHGEWAKSESRSGRVTQSGFSGKAIAIA